MTFSIYTLVRPSFPSLTRWSQTRKKFAGVTVLYLCLFSRFAQDHSLGVFALEFRAFWVDPLQRVTETIRFWADLPKLRTASASIKNSGPSFTEIRYGHRVWMGCKTPDRPRSGVLHDSDYPYAFSVKLVPKVYLSIRRSIRRSIRGSIRGSSIRRQIADSTLLFVHTMTSHPTSEEETIHHHIGRVFKRTPRRSL